jgi:cytochrome c oxidase assembly protein subunit 11
MPWKFSPLQTAVNVKPGQTALAFYTASNFTDKDITGLATYNIIPARAALYFNKIQCFCFEEQRLGAGEQIEMPVFFFLDPDIETDPNLKNTKEIVLSYTFFKSK